MTEQEAVKHHMELSKLSARIGFLEGMLMGVTYWPEVPEELKTKIREHVTKWKEEDKRNE